MPGAPARVPGVGDLDEVAADDLAVAQHADDLEQLGHPQAAGLRRAGARRLAGIEHVDVDRDVERMALGARGRSRRTTSTGWPASTG